jgi:hypothetical protein
MSKFLLSIIATTLLAGSLFGQSNLSVERRIPTVKKNKVLVRMIVLPITLNDKITKLLVAERKVSYKFGSIQLNKAFQNILLLRVAENFETGIVKNKDGTFTARMQSHPAWYPAVSYKKKLYVFTESNPDTDAEIFNIFLKRVNLKIENEAEALELANLYFSVTRGYFENRGKLILSKVEDVPLSYRERKEEETKRLKEAIISSKVKVIDGNYEVELFTWEMVLGEVKKWNFKIQPDAQIEVQSEIFGKL